MNILAADTWLSFWVPLRPLLPELQQKSHLLSCPIAGMVSSGSLKPHLSCISMPSFCYLATTSLCVLGRLLPGFGIMQVLELSRGLAFTGIKV